MAEENKNIRLSKAAKEFNIGIATVVDFLLKKGHTVENNPNTKISDTMYELLLKEFQSEKNVKEEAKKIGLEFTNRQTLSIETIEKEKHKFEEEDYQETHVKSSISANDFKKAEPILPKKEEVQQPIVDVPQPIKQVEVVAEIPEIEADLVLPIIEHKETIIEVVKEVIPETKEEYIAPVLETIKEEAIQSIEEIDQQETADTENKIKIVGMLDLSKINLKTKPDKKTKAEKEKEKVKKKADLKSKTEEISEEVVVESTPIIELEKEPIAEIIQEVVDTKDATQVNFIQTKYTKLEGPKIQGKIDLSEFNKPQIKKQPVASSSDKHTDKKRPRIKEKNKAVENINALNKKPETTRPDGVKHRVKEETKGKKKSEFKVIKAVVDDNAIEKQIKETLARMNPLGKSKTSKYRREKRSQVSQQFQDDQQKQLEEKKIIKVTEFVTANELANMMDVPVTSVISTCMSLGMFVSINQRLDAEALNIVADEFGYKVDFVSVEVLDAINISEETDNEEDLLPRAPIVAVMGHVDHGKTSLLDYIRHSNVIAGEAGGITQHIGSYEVKLPNGKKITFLDTPGHEAFTAMRARGAKVTDVAIIVVAADDKIMPQTIEAINHAQAANVPIVFAINKIDKENASPEKIKEGLAQMNILVEDWGGKYQSQEISAKKGINVEQLLEKVLLEAELLDLKGNPNKKAIGTVIESSLDKGRGYVAKILVQDGTIKIGDVVLAGSTYGKVKAMYNERNALVKTAGPSTPVLLLGLNGAPQAGDKFNVMTDEREAKDISSKRLQLQREQGIRTQKHITLDEIGRRIAIGDFKQLNIIVKGDVDGSVEALADSLLKLSNAEVQVQVIHKSVGQITESDVLLASASEAIIIGFQVRPSMSARKLAEQEQIDIRLYSIIYTAINEIKAAIEGMLSPDIVEKIICNIEIREVFKITKVGTIAGCMVLDGKITRNTKIRIIRDGIVVYTGRLGSLKRFKDDVKEVNSGFECGLNIDNFNDIKVGDIVEGYEETEVKRKL
ncbi:MAG: translation initiation factor IF-2 [Bacteroidetes bacterium]|nr:translation initiation factor IF-2 [Bacteroidota bacterium]